MGRRDAELLLRTGMTIALEPMVLVGTWQTRVLPDEWTVASADGSLTAILNIRGDHRKWPGDPDPVRQTIEPVKSLIWTD